MFNITFRLICIQLYLMFVFEVDVFYHASLLEADFITFIYILVALCVVSVLYGNKMTAPVYLTYQCSFL